LPSLVSITLHADFSVLPDFPRLPCRRYRRQYVTLLQRHERFSGRMLTYVSADAEPTRRACFFWHFIDMIRRRFIFAYFFISGCRFDAEFSPALSFFISF